MPFPLRFRDSLQVGYGIGIRPLVGLLKMYMVGESFVVGCGVFLYWRMDFWNAEFEYEFIWYA